MIYEVRTYTLKPGSTKEVEARFAEAVPHREKYSKLAAFWHTEIGPLEQVIHVWPYESLAHRTEARAASRQDPHWPPNIIDFVTRQEAEIFLAPDFMRPLPDAPMGKIYEMRTYHLKPGAMRTFLERWESAIPSREKYSPLTACWYGELTNLNRFVHVWPYESFEERLRIRAEAAKDPNWPPNTLEFIDTMENKLLFSASFSRL